MSDLPPFSYTRPRTLTAALAAIARPGACIYAGGTDVLVALASRQPWTHFVREVVDIKDIAEARGIEDHGSHLRIGALVTAEELSSDPLVRRHARVLAEAADQTSAPALRRRGTVGGNVTTPHPAGDITTALLALNARVLVAEKTARDEYPLAGFIATQTAQWPRQRMMISVAVRKCTDSAFEKVGARAAFSRSLAAAGVAALDGEVRVALGGLGERPFLAPAVAASVVERTSIDDALLSVLRPGDDGPPDQAYRLRVAAAMVRRAAARVRRR